MVVFFTTNFIAHAASVPTFPDVDEFIKFPWKAHPFLPKYIPWPPIVALFFPFIGLSRSVKLLAKAARGFRNDIQRASVYRAILVVARARDWMPFTGRAELVHVKLECLSDFNEEAKGDDEIKEAALEIVETDEVKKIEHSDWDIYGCVNVPEGYQLVIPHVEALDRIIASTLEDMSNINLCRPWRWPKMVISVVQLISALYTLYHTRGDQINRFGYAAYGLAVFPYALMSFYNMICAGVIGEWPCHYMLRTPMLEQATRRPNALFDGAIGTLKSVKDVVEGLEGGDGKAQKESLQDDNEYVAAWLSLEESSSGSLGKTLIVRARTTTRKYKLVDSANPDAGHRVFKISALTLPQALQPSCEVYDCGTLPQSTVRPSSITMPSKVTGETQSSTDTPKQEPIRKVFITLVLISLVTSLVLPYIVILVLTGFKKGNSTKAQRAWMMSWLSIGNFFSAYGWDSKPLTRMLRGFRHGSGGKRRVESVFTFVIPVLLTFAIFAVPAVGGYVMVAKMYLEDNGFGMCS
ncbi:hypothetical protein AcW1_009769 [Taiwanofungus camphoratus]|nr:hypothetical protein AcW1_009769 [Antrodia cinnamomea]KAI0948188.1 hypothetical protein AcW1_009769 [Antrodia cinnamomea]